MPCVSSASDGETSIFLMVYIRGIHSCTCFASCALYFVSSSGLSIPPDVRSVALRTTVTSRGVRRDSPAVGRGRSSAVAQQLSALGSR